jgi:hypothetical protein
MPRIPSTRLPVILTERVYSRAVLAALEEGMSLSEYTEAALAAAITRTEQHSLEREYAAACEAAKAARRPNPTRQDYFGQRQSFVRRPAGVGEKQAGRPSSRQDQKATGAQPGSKLRSRTGATRSFSPSKSEHGEDPHFDAGEHHGTTNVGPQPGRR